MTLAEVEALSWAFLVLAFGVLIRSTALALVCAGADWLLRGRTAELRFSLWRWLLLALFALPVLMSLTPPLKKASAALAHVEMVLLPASPVGSVTVGPAHSRPEHAPVKQSKRPIYWTLLPMALYFGVMFVLLARLFVAIRRLAGIARRSDPIVESGFQDFAHELWLCSGARLKPRIAVSREVNVPVTFEPAALDFDEPYILLPESWRDWEQTKLGAVLTHEMIHVRRRDSVVLLAASLATCLFWFHPLSWLLRRRLCVLAEEACDELTLALVSTPKQYAEMLIDFAQEVATHRRRVIAVTAVVQSSRIQKRIERLFVDSVVLQRGRNVIAVLIVGLFLPAIYLSAAARFDEPRQQANQVYSAAEKYWNEALLLSPENIAEMQAELLQTPDDLQIRSELLIYSAVHQVRASFAKQLLWFIQHRPQTDILRMAQMYPLPETDVQSIDAAWEKALARYSGSAAVELNAATFFSHSDPQRALEILRGIHAVQTGDTESTSTMIDSIYAAAELKKADPASQSKLNNVGMDSELALKLSDELENSGDPALLSNVGQIVVSLSPQNRPEQIRQGLALIQQAIDLDPGNQAWKDALESAKAEPARRENYREFAHAGTPQVREVRIGRGVAEANLMTKVDPVYPTPALDARIQGSVEFTVTIDPQGHVRNILLVRGHPLLVEAAKNAVEKWVYHPASLDGKAITVTTEVVVPFRLPQQ